MKRADLSGKSKRTARDQSFPEPDRILAYLKLLGRAMGESPVPVDHGVIGIYIYEFVALKETSKPREMVVRRSCLTRSRSPGRKHVVSASL